MPKRSFDRSTSPEGNVIDMQTGKPAVRDTKPVVCERIRYYRERLEMEQKVLARMVGVTANAVSNWESGRSRPDINLLPNICEALRITLYQLYDIEDPSIRYTASEEMFMEDYRRLTKGHRYAVRSLAQTLLQVQAEEHSREIEKLLYFERQLAAGIGDPSDFEDEGIPIYVYADAVSSFADCVFTVNGDSMEPEYPDGTLVCVHRIIEADRLEPGDIGAFMIDNETYIKEYQKDGLHSLNPAYSVMRFEDYDRVFLIGRVVGILDRKDIASEEDVNRYLEVHYEME